MTKLIKTAQELSNLKQNLKGSLVATNGCFDLLHVGHVRYLQSAKSLGTHLIIGVNSDASVAALKGPTRPINKAEDRAEVLNALACVDYTFIFNEDTADQFLKLAEPDIYAKGGDYNLAELPERETIKQIGAKVVFVPFQSGYSTTGTVKKLSEKL
jgi:rfaE bifunctional protein nucleotidyltransferase chain/domain